MTLGTLDPPGATNICAAVLQAVTFGVVVCDAERRIVFANSMAASLAREEFGPWQAGAVIRAGTQAESLRLVELIDQAAQAGARGVILLAGQGGTPWIIGVIAPLCASGAAQPSDHVLIALRTSQDQPSFDGDTLVELFGLSPAQAKTALALYSGRSLKEIASDRDIKISTLRTHLGEIFARSRTETQRDLVRLLSMLPPVR